MIIIRRRKLTTEALKRLLKRHSRFCNHYRLSSDRRCTCGRNQAAAELNLLLRNQVKQ